MLAFVQAISAKAPLLTSPLPIFLAVLLIILITPVLLNKLKIPYVIGLIVAGVVVGPHGLNLLARDMSFEVFGQVGILYLMFLAGIEIDMYHLRKNLSKGVVFGAFTFAVPMIIGSLGAHFLLHLEPLTCVLLASMFAAHTLISYPIVSRFGLTREKSVVIAIAGTIFTVLGSLIVLAAVAGVLRQGKFQMAGTFRLLAFLFLFCGGITYAYPRITRWFFKHYNDNVLQFIFVLSMMYLAAQLAKLAGIEEVFGAFFAGLVLNRYIPARSPLMGRIEFVGNAIFIPYFLIGVGMMLDIGVLAAGWLTLYVAAVMSAIAMGSKWIAARLTQMTYKMMSLERSMMYQLSNAHTAVALAVVTIGYGLNLFDEVILNGTIIMILITCTVSSIGTSRAARKIKMMSISDDTTGDSHAIKNPTKANILIPIATPLTAAELVDIALMMGGTQRGNVYALHVRNDNSAASRAIGKDSLNEAESAAASVDVKIDTIERYDLNFVTGVINTIEERDIDRVIIGLHRRTTVIDSFFGDKLTNLLRATNRMVVISRSFIPMNTLTRIVTVVPPKAEYETGFAQWVTALANLAGQVGCRLIFCCHDNTHKAIASVLAKERYSLRTEYHHISDWDDFILLANKILDDDLFVVVNARRSSISHSSDLDALPEFLQKYFSQNNLMVIYPEQFGDEPDIMTMAETLSTDMVVTPSPLLLRIKAAYRTMIRFRKRFTHRNRPNKIDL